jgi:hypothetical protein
VKSWPRGRDKEMRERSRGNWKGLNQCTHTGGMGPTCWRTVSPFQDLGSEPLDGKSDNARLVSDVAQY